MAYPNLLSPQQILKTAIRLVEHGDADGLSLRAVASALDVKAPSLYRYFPNKEALEVAVAAEIMSLMLTDFQAASASADPEVRFRGLAKTYLRFARERFPLYAFVVQDRHQRYESKAGKAVWNVLIDVASVISGHPDDTAAAVAIWAFLHGYATLDHSGAFGQSGPKGGLERGIDAFLTSFRLGSKPHQKTQPPRSAKVRQRKKP